jgi:protein subunit release factor B
MAARGFLVPLLAPLARSFALPCAPAAAVIRLPHLLHSSFPSSTASLVLTLHHQLRANARAYADRAVIRMGDTLVDIPREALEVSFSRSSGAGGQNVNKVNTKAEVRFKLETASWVDAQVKDRLKELYPAYVNAEGEFFVSSQVHRTQEANLRDALEKLAKFIRRAATAPKVRVQRTGLSELTKSERREDKRHRSEVKARRKGPSGGDD